MNSGPVIRGARTLDVESEWKYLPIRRLTLYIEESIDRGLEWVVHEPNDESTWSEIRQSAGNFLEGLFRQGAFVAPRPGDAYFVRCDATTATQNDVDHGIVNVQVGFAPLKPAEFVVVGIRKLLGAR